MEYSYAVTPFLAWLVAGSLKFAVNSIVERRFAYSLIGYGGMPSNHTAIVCSMAFLIALDVGVGSASFGVALTLAFIVILDASSLRRQIGQQARVINSIRLVQEGDEDSSLRERMGHTPAEILVGVAVGFLVAFLVHSVM